MQSRPLRRTLPLWILLWAHSASPSVDTIRFRNRRMSGSYIRFSDIAWRNYLPWYTYELRHFHCCCCISQWQWHRNCKVPLPWSRSVRYSRHSRHCFHTMMSKVHCHLTGSCCRICSRVASAPLQVSQSPPEVFCSPSQFLFSHARPLQDYWMGILRRMLHNLQYRFC